MRHDDDYGDWMYDRKVDEALDRKADEEHTAFLESLTDEQARRRHYILDSKGVAATLFRTQASKMCHMVPVTHGRYDPEKREFYYVDDDNYRCLYVTPLKHGGNTYFLVLGTERVLGELVLEGDK